ncbi:hypothetical protein [Xylanibacillus composti]|uniref:Uncharacterized protein n=1 Tax=Xylanibacillus composti TaxID=1572762 RepID=A0A8J4H913_9BACL|nr:hypothetical protein [Xylanibacillus composti]GIQ71439.1 hypothetical protein XYCOK13_42630 [Xylanibacillus composti]
MKSLLLPAQYANTRCYVPAQYAGIAARAELEKSNGGEQKEQKEQKG